MIFRFKKNKIVLEAFTFTEDLINLFPITYSKESYPHWYQSLSNSNPTIKHCMGFQDLYNRSLTMPAWAEYLISIEQDGFIKVDSPMKHETPEYWIQHNLEIQANGAWPGYANIKLRSPWFLKTDRMVKWLMIPATWEQRDPGEWLQVPGSLEFKYQHQTNINGLFKIETAPKKIKIKAGQPLVHLVPLFDSPWELKLRIMEGNDYKKYFSGWPHSFNYVYQKTRSILERRNK